MNREERDQLRALAEQHTAPFTMFAGEVSILEHDAAHRELCAAVPRLLDELDAAEKRWREMFARAEWLAEAILDIDEHATPLGQDEEGMVATGYLVSVGSLHRALARVTGATPLRTTQKLEVGTNAADETQDFSEGDRSA